MGDNKLDSAGIGHLRYLLRGLEQIQKAGLATEKTLVEIQSLRAQLDDAEYLDYEQIKGLGDREDDL